MLLLLFLYLYVCGICTYECTYSCVCRFQAHTGSLCKLLSAIFIEAGSLNWIMNTLIWLVWISILLCYFSFLLPASGHNRQSTMPTWHLHVFWGSELWSSHLAASVLLADPSLQVQEEMFWNTAFRDCVVATTVANSTNSATIVTEKKKNQSYSWMYKKVLVFQF